MCLTIMHAFETFLRLSGALREEAVAAAAAPPTVAAASPCQQQADFKEEKQTVIASGRGRGLHDHCLSSMQSSQPQLSLSKENDVY